MKRPSAEWIREFCLSFPGAIEDHPWGDTVWKVGGKIFCFSSESGDVLTVKTSNDRQAALVQDPAIERAAYVGRFGWVTVRVGNPELVALAEELVADSYQRVLAGLPKKSRPS